VEDMLSVRSINPSMFLYQVETQALTPPGEPCWSFSQHTDEQHSEYRVVKECLLTDDVSIIGSISVNTCSNNKG
jgi:hypothetical protein